MFYHVFTVHAIHEHHFTPVVVFLMDGKSTEKYRVAFEKLKRMVPFLKPVIGIADFEEASRNAIEEVFPGLVVHGCYFHATQAKFLMVLKLGPSILYS